MIAVCLHASLSNSSLYVFSYFLFFPTWSPFQNSDFHFLRYLLRKCLSPHFLSMSIFFSYFYHFILLIDTTLLCPLPLHLSLSLSLFCSLSLCLSLSLSPFSYSIQDFGGYSFEYRHLGDHRIQHIRFRESFSVSRMGQSNQWRRRSYVSVFVEIALSMPSHSFVYLSVWESVYLFIHLSVYLSMSLSV